MKANGSMTLCIKTDGGDAPAYTRVFIVRVMWQGHSRANVADKGLVKADSVKVFIPFTAVPPGTEPHKGDLIARGYRDDVLTGPKPDGFMTVLSVARRDFGSRDMQHWEVEAV